MHTRWGGSLFVACAVVASTVAVTIPGSQGRASAATGRVPSVSVGDVSMTEGTTGKDRVVQIPVTLSSPATQQLVIPYTVRAGSASTPDDYLPPSPTASKVTLKPVLKTGVTNGIGFINIKVKADDVDEGSEALSVELTSPSPSAGYEIAKGTGSLTIVDDDDAPTPPTVSVGSVTVREGHTGLPVSVHVPLTLSAPSSTPLSVEYRFVSDSATSPSDFDNRLGRTLIAKFPLGTNGLTPVSKQVPVKVIRDLTNEPDESFSVEILTVTPGYGANPVSGTVTIANDDSDLPLTRRLESWGTTFGGVLGSPGVKSRTTPAAVDAADDWASVSTGGIHAAAVKTDGSLWAWGSNSRGAVGDGTTTSRGIPVKISSSNDWQSVSASAEHVVAIKTDGTLWAWGDNGLGQLGDGTTTTRFEPTRIGSASDWASVVTEWHHTVALKRDGSLWAWGDNSFGQLGDGTTTAQLAPVRVGIATDWVQASVGDGFTAALKRDGSLWTWGSADRGRLADGTSSGGRLSPARAGTDDDWSSIASGQAHTLATKTDGSLWSWGGNVYGELGDGTNIDRATPVQIGSSGTWVQVSAAQETSAAIRIDGALWTWGYGTYGALGDGSISHRNVPAQVGIGTVWGSVAVSSYSTLAITRAWTAEPPAEPYDGDSFYAPPMPFAPGAPGDIIWRSSDLGYASGGFTYGVLYHSRSALGHDIAVSGLIFVPHVRSGDGSRPVVAWAHGTSGQGDGCAPSRQGQVPLYVDQMLAAGYVVAATDFEGLGGPDASTFATPESEAHAVLDSIRAARQLAPEASSRAVMFGASQGGHAVTAAAQRASSYAPELQVKGAVGSGAGVFVGDKLFASLAQGQYRGFGLMYADGIDAAFPGRGVLDYWLTPTGINELSYVRANCVFDVIGHYQSFWTSAQLFQPGLLTNPTTLPVASTPELADVLSRTRMDTLPIPSAIPVLYVHGRFDDLVPPPLIPEYVRVLCNGGSTVQLRWYNEGHVPSSGSQTDVLNWIRDRFAGLGAPSSCAAIPNP